LKTARVTRAAERARHAASDVRDLSKLSREELELLSTAQLDREAFGFVSGEMLAVPVDEIHIKYKGDLENAESEITTVTLARRLLDRRISVEISLRHGRLELEDGHHRYVAAKMVGRKTLDAFVDIHDDPITKILRSR
jgi:hypothetical protein